MKKVFTLLALLVCVLGTYAEEIDVVLDKTTATTTQGSAPWYFTSKDVKVKITGATNNFWPEGDYISYEANRDLTINVPVNFIPSKIKFEGYSRATDHNTTLIFNGDNSNKKTFNKEGEENTTCEFAWPEGEKSAAFRVEDIEKGVPMNAIITITGELKPYYATMAKSGYCTFSAGKKVKVSDGVKIIGVSTYNKNTNQITTVNFKGNVIPAETGVILKGQPEKTYYFEETTAVKEPADDSNLKAAVTSTTIDNTYTFVLICNSNNDAQFARLSKGSTIPPGKAYLEIPDLATSSANSLSLYFSDATGIHEVKAAVEADDNYYTLDGRKLTTRPDHGTYIHRGHVYMAK